MYPLVSKAIICGLFGVSRQAWYDIKKRQSQQQMQEVFILRLAKELRQEHRRMGAEKLLYLLTPILQERNIKYGRDKFYSLLSAHGLLVRRRKRRPRTTNSNHLFHKFPNLIKDIQLFAAGRLWVSDITYIRLRHGFAYLSLVTDAYSRRIMGWCLWADLSSQGALNALKMANGNEEVRKGHLIHHSDRGIQYCCYDYVNYLRGCGICISMTENGDPYENPIAERINGILKDEYNLAETFISYREALEATEVAVSKYNNVRPHRSLGFMVPVEAHEHTGPLRKHWYPKSNKVQSVEGVTEKLEPADQH